jgi:acetyltransferase-like isoleucine patch superfamily enzyme
VIGDPITSVLDRVLNSDPRVYKAIYQARANFYLLFGFVKNLKEYGYKRAYLKRFKNSWVYFNIPIKDTRCDIKVGRYSHSSTMVRIEWVPVDKFQYSVHVGSFTHINNNLKIILSKAHTLDSVSNNLNSLFLDRRGHELYERYHKEAYGTVSIGNDVWIGDDVTIIGNVKIGDGAVVGARSIVTRDVEPYMVVAGAPARPIRYRLDEKTRRSLLQIKWWGWDDQKIIQNLELFYHPEKFIKKHRSKGS